MADADGWAVLGTDRQLRFGRHAVRAAIGRAGITRHKAEGDSATPAGQLPLMRVLYRADRLARPGTRLPAEPIAPQDGWCDDPRDPAYNTQLRLPHNAHHEALWRRDALYDVIAVLGWNHAPVVRGQGSAIFLHVASPDHAPTEGCVALAMPDLLMVLSEGLVGVTVEG